MTSVALCPAPNYRSLTLAGAPNAGGKLYTYISGTTTNQATYTSSTAGTLNANPVIFDANGFANVWLDTTLTYTLLETDSAGVTIRTQDVISNAAGATGAAGTFACSAAGGTVDAITATYSPVLTLADKTMCAIVSAGANTLTNPTFAPDGLTAHTVTKLGGTALVAGDIGPALSVHILEYNLANTRWEVLNPAAGGTNKMVLLGTATASASSTLDFTSLISTSYKHYKLVVTDLICGSTATTLLLCASDNATFTDTMASQVGAHTFDTNAPTYTATTDIGTGVVIIPSIVGAVAASGHIDFTVGVRCSIGQGYFTSAYFSHLPKDVIFTTDNGAATRLNAIRLKPSAGTFTSGTVRLYGVSAS